MLVVVVKSVTIGCSDRLVRLSGTEHTWGMDHKIQDMRAAEASHVRGKDKYKPNNRLAKYE